MGIESLYFNSNNSPKVVGANYDNSKMSKRDFMRILLTQLQWQDPLEAENIDDIINNSVKLREMEVLNSFEDSVNQMVGSIKSLSLFYASGFIGKDVIYKGSKVFVNDGVGKFSFHLDSPASKVSVLIFDSNGNVVDKKEFFNLSARDYPVEVDLKDGVYSVSVEADYVNGERGNLKIESSAKVFSVRKGEDGVLLDTEVGEIPMENIIGIGG